MTVISNSKHTGDWEFELHTCINDHRCTYGDTTGTEGVVSWPEISTLDIENIHRQYPHTSFWVESTIFLPIGYPKTAHVRLLALLFVIIWVCRTMTHVYVKKLSPVSAHRQRLMVNYTLISINSFDVTWHMTTTF